MLSQNNNNGNFNEKTDNYDIKINYPLTGYKKLNGRLWDFFYAHKNCQKIIKFTNKRKKQFLASPKPGYPPLSF